MEAIEQIDEGYYNNIDEAINLLATRVYQELGREDRDALDAQLAAITQQVRAKVLFYIRQGKVDEANQGGKTEHSGAKKGKGAYYGRKKDAKQDSKKNRRKADKAETNVEETVEIIGEGRQFVDSASMVRWMLSGLKKMQQDYYHGDVGDVEELFADVMEDIDKLVEEMENAEIKQYPSRPTHGRRPGYPRRPFSSRK